MKKINLFIFATHHSSKNIASLRFMGLVKYLDKKKFRIFIFTREQPLQSGSWQTQDNENIQVLGFPGRCVGSESSIVGSLFVLLSAFLSFLPFFVGLLSERESATWMVNALRSANKLCGDLARKGEACIAIGTYSPLDASIAARCLSARFRVPCLQDFRDGMTFEFLGKQGRLRSIFKKMIEKKIVKTSVLVTSVSRALVDDFEKKYPLRKVRLMPNGYDPADFNLVDPAGAIESFQIISKHVAKGKFLIGHFGRIGASDFSSTPTLRFVVLAMNENLNITESAHLLMVGELTQTEIDILGRLRCSHSIVGKVERSTALALMGNCDTLLLITGNRVSCATGKLYEYLATNRSIICFSAVINEASRILSETHAGRTVLISAGAKAQEELDNLFILPKRFESNRDIIDYSKVQQAKKFGHWLTEMVH